MTPEETAVRMFVYADRRDWDSLARLLDDTVRIDWTSLNGGEPADVPADELVRGWKSVLGGFKADSASDRQRPRRGARRRERDAELLRAATHLLPSDLGDSRWTVGGHYELRLKRRDDGWLIAAATFTASWGDGNKDLLGLAAAS